MKALITGASSGIGAALAPLLAAKGYSLILTGRDEKRLRVIAEPLHAEVIITDLLVDRAPVIEAIRQNAPELLINSAGFGLYGEMLKKSFEEQFAVLEINAHIPIELTLEAARALRKADKKGVILNISSVAGELPAPGMGLYGPAKACLTHFSQTLNTELKGIDVLVTCPGMVATEFASRAANKKIAQRGVCMSASFAAQQIVKQIEKRQEKRIINWFYRLATRLTPVSLAKKLIWKRIQERL